jgi:hypothetical protein
LWVITPRNPAESPGLNGFSTDWQELAKDDAYRTLNKDMGGLLVIDPYNGSPDEDWCRGEEERQSRRSMFKKEAEEPL